MHNVVEIRKAAVTDSDFLADIILKAEDTGVEIVSYTKMFNKSIANLKPSIKKAIENEYGGHPFTYKSFYMATVDEVSASAISAYVEGENGDSNHLITGALMSVFSRDEMKQAFQLIAQNKEIQIPKTKGTLQLDSIATLEEYRGKGLLRNLFDFVFNEYKNQGISIAEIQVWRSNLNALAVYRNMGFEIALEKLSNNEINNGKVLMRKKL